MKIVSTTLTGNAAALIGDALRSVAGWVDACLVIDTGVTDDTLDRAREAAGAKYAGRAFPWRNDFSAARNFALDAALDLGGDWAVTVDTDERIDPRGEDLRAVLGAADVACIMVLHDGSAYAKERMFRLPARARWSGPTHEAFPAYTVGYRVLERARFVELPKSPDEVRRKFERDVEILRRHLREHPREPRWHYYLGDALEGLGRHREAIRAFDACAKLRGWNEESAWACYRAAARRVHLGEWNAAVDACAAGLARHAAVAELAWLAAYASWKAGRHDQAVAWARMSVANGCFRGAGATAGRIGFRNPMALYEGPFDVLRWALRALGDEEGAADAELAYEEARAVRSGKNPS